MRVIRKGTVFSTLSVIIVLVAAALIGAANKPKKADADSCAIYRAVFETDVLRWGNDSNHFSIKPLSLKDSEVHDYGAAPPKTFSRDTGKTKQVMSDFTGELEDRIITEEFDFDSSEFFSGIFPSEVRDLRDCYSAIENSPRVEDVDYKIILEYEKEIYKEDAQLFTLWSFTTPVFSDDAQHAIIFIENYCGGSCGQGYYMLLEKSESQWKPMGIYSIWIS